MLNALFVKKCQIDSYIYKQQRKGMIKMVINDKPMYRSFSNADFGVKSTHHLIHWQVGIIVVVVVAVVVFGMLFLLLCGCCFIWGVLSSFTFN